MSQAPFGRGVDSSPLPPGEKQNGLLSLWERVRVRECNKKATVLKCTVAEKTQKKTFNGLQAHFEMGSIFDYGWL